MSAQKIGITIMGPVKETRVTLAALVEATNMATVKSLVEEYCLVEDDDATQRCLEAQPDILLIDMHDMRSAVKALYLLHSLLPETWLYACSGANDPQLIIETMHAGAREYLAKPVSGRNLSLALGRYIEEKERLSKEVKTRGKIYSVTSAKGGAGATSVAVNLATGLAENKGTRVGLVDMNSPVGDIASYLDLKPQFSLSDALIAAPRMDSTLLETFMTMGHRIAVLPGPKQFKPGTSPVPSALAKLLRVLTQTYTHTFIDMPATLDPEFLQTVAENSEAILVVLTPELPALWRTHRLISALSGYGCGNRIRLILNRENSRDEINEREIGKALNHSIYWRLPNNYNSAIQAINSGKPIIALNHSGLSASYKKLAQELTGMDIPKPRRRLLGLLA
jgi:pilus assembly protein CpaE